MRRCAAPPRSARMALGGNAGGSRAGCGCSLRGAVGDASFPGGIRTAACRRPRADPGYVMLAAGWPARRMREAHLDTIVWKDPRSAASLQWSVPREEIRIVPVSFQ